MEVSYTELRSKEVVNLQNGTKMGRIIDLIIDSNGKNVLGLVVPGIRKLFKASEDIFIPWNNISKIGEDIILVSININSLTTVTKTNDKDKSDGCFSCAEDDFV